MHEYLLWLNKFGYEIPKDPSPNDLAELINEKANEGDADPFREFTTHINLVGRCWQGRERSVGIDGAGWTEAEIVERGTPNWAAQVWAILSEDWCSTFTDVLLEKVNA